MDNFENIHVAWFDSTDYFDPDSGFCGSDDDIFYKCKPAGGDWGVTEVVSTESNEYSFRFSLDVETNGKVHIAWEEPMNNFPYYYNILYKSKKNNSKWPMGPSSTEIISKESTGDSFWPSLKVDSNGTIHIAWEDLNHPLDYFICYKKKSHKENWSNTEIISTESTLNSWSPSLAVDQNNIAHVVWWDNTNYYDPKSGYCDYDLDIFYKKNYGKTYYSKGPGIIIAYGKGNINTELGQYNLTYGNIKFIALGEGGPSFNNKYPNYTTTNGQYTKEKFVGYDKKVGSFIVIIGILLHDGIIIGTSFK